MMRIIPLAIPFAAAVAGTLAIYAASTGDTVDPNAREYLLMAKRAPDQLQKLIAAVLPACLSDTARPYITDRGVADLVARTLLRSGTLMAAGKTSVQSSEGIVPYILEHARSLSPAQRATYVNLMKGGHVGPDTLLCVYSSLKTASAGHVQFKSVTRDLRE
jgi:hypothetical protein